MMNEDIEKIEAYLNGELSGGERRIFEAAMTSDPALRQEVAAHRVVQEAIVDHELLTVKKEIRNVMDGAGHSHFGRNGRVALGLGGILVAGLLTWWITSPDNVMVSELNEVPVAVDSMVVTDARVPVVPEPSDRNAVLPTGKTRLETHTVPEKTEEPVNHEKNADAATDLVQAGPLQVLPQPVRKKTSDLNVTMPLNSSPKIKPVQPSGTEAGSCFTGMTNDPLLVTDECRTGFVRIAEDWIRRAKANKWGIMLLPDSVTMKESLQTNLKPGAYRLMISDGRDCQFTRTFIITGNECPDEQKVFSPGRGEKWTFNTPEHTAGRIDIVNRNGSLMKRLYFDAGGSTFWDGYLDAGSLAPTGAYFYVVTEKNGQEIDHGTLTLIH